MRSLQFGRLLLVLAVLTIGNPSYAQFSPADDNSHWDPAYRYMGFGLGGIEDFAFLHDTIVAYGYFHSAGGYRTPGIAWYNGSLWHRMGTAQDDLGHISAVIPDGSSLYAAGAFYFDVRKPLHNFARWDWSTSSWNDVDGGIRSTPSHQEHVNTMLRIADDIYIGGAFDTAGTITANNIVRYNLRDHSWHPLRQGVQGNWSEVRTLTTDGTWLYVGGTFDDVDDSIANSIARWNLKSERWDAFGLVPDSLGPIEVDAICLYKDSLIVGGQFDSVGGVRAQNIIKFDGSWKPFGSLWAQPRHFEMFHDALVETGYSCRIDDCWHDFKWWNGTTWIAMGTQSTPDPIRVHNGDLYAANGLWIDSTYNHMIARFHLPDSSWVPLDDITNYGPLSEVDHIARVGSKIYITGWHWESTPSSFFGSDRVQTLEVLDKGTWKVVERNGPHSGAYIFSDSSSLYAFGSMQISPSSWVGTIERYNESLLNWEILDTLRGGAFSNAVIFHEGLFYFGGRFDSINHVKAHNVISFDPVRRIWNPLGDGVPCHGDYSNVNALTFYKGDLIAAGKFDTTLPNILRFDRTTGLWQPFGDTVMRGWIQSLAASSTELYAGGQFSKIGGKNIHYLARWSGEQWQPLTPEIDPNWYEVSIEQMAIQNDKDLIVGGFFWTIGGAPFQHIARWDGTSWHPLGSGTDERVVSLATTGSDVYIGGYFNVAGDYGVNEFAHWRTTSQTPIIARPAITSSLYPNPASDNVTIDVQIAIAGRLQIDLFNTAGMRVATLFDNDVTAGERFVDVDLTDMPLANGAYYLQVKLGDLTTSNPISIKR